MDTFGNLCISFAVGLVIFNIGSEHFWSEYLPFAIVFFLVGIGLKKLDFYLWDKKTSKERENIAKNIQPAESNLVEEKTENNEQKVEVSSSETVIETETNTWQCPNCGEVNSKKFCKECGTEKPVKPVIKDRFCTNCGTKLKEHQKFCGKCGTKVDNE